MLTLHFIRSCTNQCKKQKFRQLADSKEPTTNFATNTLLPTNTLFSFPREFAALGLWVDPGIIPLSNQIIHVHFFSGRIQRGPSMTVTRYKQQQFVNMQVSLKTIHPEGSVVLSTCHASRRLMTQLSGSFMTTAEWHSHQELEENITEDKIQNSDWLKNILCDFSHKNSVLDDNFIIQNIIFQAMKCSSMTRVFLNLAHWPFHCNITSVSKDNRAKKGSVFLPIKSVNFEKKEQWAHESWICLCVCGNYCLISVLETRLRTLGEIVCHKGVLYTSSRGKSVHTKRKRKFSLMFTIFSLISFACCFVFFTFACCRCKRALTVSHRMYAVSTVPFTCGHLIWPPGHLVSHSTDPDGPP